MIARIRRVPALGWLAAIVVGSAFLRAWMVRGMPAPFIFIDELIYSELAKSVASGEGYAVRGDATSGYSLLYPLLIAPAYRLEGLVTAHLAAQTINAVVMSLAPIPAYFLARRVAGNGLALLVALGSVAIPSMAYTGTITTESLFYPVAIAVALALVRYLEHPTRGRLWTALIAVAVAYSVHSRGLAFGLALLTAPLLLAAIRGRWHELRAHLPLYGLVLGAAVTVVLVQVLRGSTLTALFGSYQVVGEAQYSLGAVVRFWLWHVEEIVILVVVAPLAALGILVARSRSLPVRLQEHVAATLAMGGSSTVMVAAFASRFASDRVQDRYLFFLTPLLLVALVGWVSIGAPRPRLITGVTLATLVVLVALFPYTRFVGEPARSDTIGLLPVWAAGDHYLGGRAWLTITLVAGALALLVAVVPTRGIVLLPVLVVAAYAMLSRPVWASPIDPRGFKASSVGALFQGIRAVPRDWIDDRVPSGAEVVALWRSGEADVDRFTVNQNEFFNRRVGRVLYTEQPTPGGLAETPVRLGRDGVFVDSAGSPITAPYALLDAGVVPNGRVVARDEGLGTTLWRLTGPLAQTTFVRGIYPGDTWSGPVVTWRRVGCRPGVLETRLWSDPNAVTATQTVTATTAGRTVAALRVDPTQSFGPDHAIGLTVRVRPVAGVCVVRYRVRPTVVPSQVDPVSQDDRVLGAHFGPFTYTPDR